MSHEPIQNQKRRERLIVANGNTNDIIRVLMDTAEDDGLKKQVEQFAQRFKGTDPQDQYAKLKEVWRFYRKEIQYEEDPPGEQYIKEPGRVYWDNLKGDGSDCKSLSLSIYFVCRCIGVPVYFEFVSFLRAKDWVEANGRWEWQNTGRRITHVFPVAIVPGIGEVVLDAVYTKFDERPPGITRTVKRHTKTFTDMTKIYRVSGLKGTAPTKADLEAEYNDRAKLVKPLAPVDTIGLTEGEMTLYLQARIDKMLGEFYQGTPQGQSAMQAYLRKRDMLRKGLHRSPSFLSFGLAGKTKPASGYFSSMAAKGLDIKAGIPHLFDDADNTAVRGIGSIPQQDCNALFTLIDPAQFPGQGWVEVEGYNISQLNKRQACRTENLWREALNNWWEKSGTVLLYEFLTPAMVPNGLTGDATLSLGGKADRHKEFVSRLQMGAKISKTNLDLWLKSGCIQYSIQGSDGKSLGPSTPEDWITAYRQGGAEGIGIFPLIVIPIALAVSAIGFNGFKNLIQVIKGNQTLKQAIQTQVNDIESFFNKYGNQLTTLGAPSDFSLLSNNGGNGGGNGGNGGNGSNCDPGFHYDPTTQTCVPDAPPSGSSNKGLLIGGAVVLGGLILMSKD